MACSLFGLGGRGSRGGGGVFQSTRGNFPRRKPRHHSLVLDGQHLEISEETMGWINYFLRRGAHLTIYFCMGLGLALAFRWQKKVAPWIPAMALGVVFAASDELHQFYTGNRTASPGDVLLDSVGLAAGCAAAWFLRRCWEKRHTKP